MFHSGSVQITWLPGTDIGTPADTTTGTYALREIVDIRYQSEVTLNLPYMVYLPYLATNHSISNAYYSGYLEVRVLNELRAPENCQQKIIMMVYYEAGDDYDLQIPGDIGLGILPVSPQMDETIVNTGIANSRRMNTNVQASSHCIGEHFTSVKQLLNRFSQIYCTSFPSTSSEAVLVWPWLNSVVSLNGSGSLVAPLAGGDIYPVIANMYAFFRGSVRLCMNGSPTVGHNPIAMSLYTLPTATVPITGGVVDRGTHAAIAWTGSAAGALTMSNGITETDCDETHAYGRVPYYCKTPCSLVAFQATAGDAYPQGVSQPIVRVNFCSPAAGLVDYSLYRSFPDDFQLSYFIGMPPIVTSYS
jgi:hypothetical protein